MKECIICKKSRVKEIVRNKLSMFECRTCSLVWMQEFDVSTFHYQDDNISLGEATLNARIKNVKSRIKFIKRHFSPNNLCDIGAGEGIFLLELKEGGYKNVIGIEPNKKAVSFAKSKGLNIFEGTFSNATNIIKDNNIHAVTLFHVIEHLKDPLGVLKQIYTSLNPGDHLVIETPNADAYSVVKTNYKHPLIYTEHLFYFNTSNLGLLLESVGFKIIAKGKRGFNQSNMSIRKSLFCLGIGKPPFLSLENKTIREASRTENNSPKSSIIRTLIRRVLSLLVVLLGRVDYQWVIVRK